MRQNRLFQVLLLSLLAGPSWAATIAVPADQPTIQDAINVAVAGDLILVSAGDYPERIDFMGKAIHVKSESGAALTTIQAGGLGSVVTATSGETSATVLEGFTLDGGDDVMGGGIHVNAASPTFRSCVVRNCFASFGGGAYVSSGNPVFHWCQFDNNVASSGGGLFVNGNASVDDCDFRDNYAWSTGGAIYHEWGHLEAKKSLIENNEAGNNAMDQGSGGAVYAIWSSIEMNDIAFKSNTAWAAGGIWSYRCSINVSNSVFEGNGAETAGGSALAYYGEHHYRNCAILDSGAGEGGGFMHEYSLVTMVECDFKNNTASGRGGAFCGLDLELGSTLRSSSLTGNSAETGGGLMITGISEFDMHFTVFTDNHAILDGGGIHAEWTSFNSNQCAFLGNTSGRHGAALSMIDSGGSFQVWQAGQNAAGGDGGAVHAVRGGQYFFYADFQSNTATKGGGMACRECDVTVSGSDIRINGAVAGGGGFHIEAPGELQIGGSTVCGNDPDQIVGPFIEFAPNTIAAECSDCPGDVDADAFIGIDDLLAVINSWGACGGCPEDVDGDGVVGIADLLTVLENWGWCA
ncbi:MAG: hypothetical protein MK116_11305 [Phycisphaerales bacterium]|nr:hypothetical protein [Phycisphaerales bacterium]